MTRRSRFSKPSRRRAASSRAIFPASWRCSSRDLKPRDLLLPHLRRRTGLIADSVFHSERGRAVAGVYFTAFGGLAVSYTFTDGPRYFQGNVATIGVLIGLCLIIAGLDLWYFVQNRRKEELKGTEEWEEARLPGEKE